MALSPVYCVGLIIQLWILENMCAAFASMSLCVTYCVGYALLG